MRRVVRQNSHQIHILKCQTYEEEGWRGLAAGQDGRHRVRLCRAPGRLFVLFILQAVVAGADLGDTLGSPVTLWALWEHPRPELEPGTARAGLTLASAHARSIESEEVRRPEAAPGERAVPGARVCPGA
ncbi:hypothetical protein NDU88_007392 [Pleurodeles waltl]|uniref:Uncharacterized protein n=1 Tax=Pleurodeles waltl TaxID=8319 RepID=A0AAV7U2Y2_PLEWA|nr:hypothetical protein NDU88_007392 [Pleurodeles waltl]